MGQQIGNYNLIRLLGQGGFAEVYLGEHIYLKTQAAIKVLHTQLASSEIQSFLVEARTIAHLEHPHIVRVKACQSTLPYTSAQPFAETPSSELPKTITVTPLPGQLPQPTVIAPPPPQPTAVVPLPNQSPERTVAANSSVKPLPTTIQRRWRPWVVLFAFFVLVIGTTLVYFEHTFIPTGTIQSKSPVSTFTAITTSTVHVYDKANVLNVSQVQSEAAKLPNNIDIYTVNNFTGSNSAFDQETAQHTANNANLIVIAIDTVHHHLAIKAGSNVRLSNSQADDARNAFINNFQNGDYTGATIAAIHSLQNSLK